MNTPNKKLTFNIDHNEPEQLRALTAPTVIGPIYDEDHQGLLPITALTQPLRVELTAWDSARAGDTYQLLWNNVLVSAAKTITTEQEGDALFLELPAQFIQAEGVHGLAYRTVNVRNGTHVDSMSVRVEVDLTAPGQPELGPVKFPEEIDCGLTSAELANLGDQLVARIGSYAGIYQHDVIRTYWGDIEGPGAVVSKIDSGLNRIEIIYTRDFLLGLGDFDGFVTYTVTDRAGNTSAPSLGAHIRLLLNDALECFEHLAPTEHVSVGRYSNNVMEVTLHLQSTASTSNK